MNFQRHFDVRMESADRQAVNAASATRCITDECRSEAMASEEHCMLAPS